MDINLHDQPADSSSGTSSRAQGGASTNGAGHHASASGTTINVNGNGGPQILVIHNIHQMNYIQKTENVTNNYYASASQYSQESAVDNET